MAKRKKHKPNSLHLAVLAGIASINANAGGLGEIAVRSRLNEPLRAVVPLNDVEPKLADRAVVRIHAPPVDAAGSTNSSVVSKLTGKVVRGKDGIVLEIRSNGTIREPVVSFHVELILPNAHTRREYTVLLDPPAEATDRGAVPASAPAQANPYDFAAMERSLDTLAATPGSKRNRKVRAPTLDSAADAPPSAPTRAATASRPAHKPTAVRAAKPTPVSNAPTPAFSGDVYGPVVKNETLWSIARKVRPSRDMSMFDVMQLIFAENPHAFVKNDMNRLRVGVTLQIPSFGSTPDTTIADTSPASGGEVHDATAPAQSTNTGTAPTAGAASTVTAAATQAAATPPENNTPAAGDATQRGTPAATTANATDTGADAPVATAPAGDGAPQATQTAVPASAAAAAATAPAEPAVGAVQQADAMQAQLNQLATRLEQMQSTLADRESKIASLEQTLTALNERLKASQERSGATAATPAPVSASAPEPPAQALAPASTTATATPPADAAATPAESAPTSAGDAAHSAFFEGIRLPENSWVWGMSAAVIAGLGAAFLARRRRVAKSAPTPKAPLSASSPASVAAAAQSESDARRTEQIISAIAPPVDDYQRTVKLERPPVQEPAAAQTASNAATLDPFNATAIDIAPTDASALAWEPNNTVPNWSLERTIERTLEETGETLAQTRTEPFLANLHAEDLPASAAATASNKVVPLKLDAARVEPVLKEVDLQMAYLQFEDAERLLMQPLQENPNEPSLLVKLAEVHVAAGNIDRFVDLAVRLSKIPEVREGADWKKIARMGEMVAPNHPLFEFVDTVELTSDNFNVASNG